MDALSSRTRELLNDPEVREQIHRAVESRNETRERTDRPSRAPSASDCDHRQTETRVRARLVP
jgi:hypothetical protein